MDNGSPPLSLSHPRWKFYPAKTEGEGEREGGEGPLFSPLLTISGRDEREGRGGEGNRPPSLDSRRFLYTHRIIFHRD